MNSWVSYTPLLWTRSLTAWVQLGRRSENEALYDSRAQRARLSFAMALSLFEARRDAVLNEANAIGTTALRARLLPAPHD
ncbi:MAG: hypothetical protein WAL59_17350, partial [Roseiarcus sp.]